MNDKKVSDEFKEKLKLEQRKLRNKSLEKGVDYQDVASGAPFGISEEHLITMTNDDWTYYQQLLKQREKRSLSPATMWQIEEEA
jgi:hypothetical protein